VVPPAEAGSADPVTLPGDCPAPDYPRLAEDRGWTGTVIVTIDVRADGTVSDVRVVESSGRKVLDEEVLDTVREWKFTPGLQAGVPVKTEILKTFRFEDPDSGVVSSD
jgi:protein TonB